MTYAQACSIFGFQMNDRIEKKEVKQRFNKLVLKFHPDHGGTAEQFQLLREAQKIMETHRHDKGEESIKKKGNINFHKVNYDDMTNTIHRETAANPENRSFGALDISVFLVILGCMTAAYMYQSWQTQKHLARSKWRMTEDKVGDMETVKKGAHAWHPWGASQDERDQSYVLGVLQGSMKEEVLRERNEALYPADAPAHPLVYRGSPWGSNPSPQTVR
jgi:hypothetical protein